MNPAGLIWVLTAATSPENEIRNNRLHPRSAGLVRGGDDGVAIAERHKIPEHARG